MVRVDIAERRVLFFSKNFPFFGRTARPLDWKGMGQGPRAWKGMDQDGCRLLEGRGRVDIAGCYSARIFLFYQSASFLDSRSSQPGPVLERNMHCRQP